MRNMEKIDLHLHTNLSDGVLSPEEVVKLSIKNNCFKISITDHEMVNDYSDLANKYGISIISGVEFNSSIRNMHILGYGIDNMDIINDRMRELRLMNEDICLRVIELMEKAGYDISLEKIVDYLIKSNLSYEMIDKRKIVKYLIYKGYVDNVLDAYNQLIGFNQEFYVPNYKISPYEIIDLIKESGGISVLAHPNTLNLSLDELYTQIKKLKLNGLMGLEIINGKMLLNEKELYEQIAVDLKLIQTVGSDFHNPELDEIGIVVNDDVHNNLKKHLILSKSKKIML